MFSQNQILSPTPKRPTPKISMASTTSRPKTPIFTSQHEQPQPLPESEESTSQIPTPILAQYEQVSTLFNQQQSSSPLIPRTQALRESRLRYEG